MKFWNISNDEHYNPKILVQEAVIATASISTKHLNTALTLQHTKAALDLNPYFFPTNFSSPKLLRNFHRYPLKFYSIALNNESNFKSIRCVLRKFKPTMDKPQFQLNFSSM